MPVSGDICSATAERWALLLSFSWWRPLMLLNTTHAQGSHRHSKASYAPEHQCQSRHIHTFRLRFHLCFTRIKMEHQPQFILLEIVLVLSKVLWSILKRLNAATFQHSGPADLRMVCKTFVCICAEVKYKRATEPEHSLHRQNHGHHVSKPKSSWLHDHK